MTRPGIDPGTVRLVVQRLNHYATPGPYYLLSLGFYNMYVGVQVWRLSHESDALRMEAATLVPIDLCRHILEC